jgi:hypothetical protein
MTRHLLAHEQEPMKMIGHYCKFKQFHFRMKVRNLPPTIGDGFAKRCKRYLFSDKPAENRTTILHVKRNHIYAAFTVVMAEASSLHGMFCWPFHISHIVEKGRRDFKCRASR